jgi:hypothetical protein
MNSCLREMRNERSPDYTLRRATRKLRQPITYIPPLRKTDGDWTKNTKEKTEAFANYLELTFQPNTTQKNAINQQEYNT